MKIEWQENAHLAFTGTVLGAERWKVYVLHIKDGWRTIVDDYDDPNSEAYATHQWSGAVTPDAAKATAEAFLNERADLASLRVAAVAATNAAMGLHLRAITSASPMIPRDEVAEVLGRIITALTSAVPE
jgi:hypothetical protein